MVGGGGAGTSLRAMILVSLKNSCSFGFSFFRCPLMISV